MESTKLLTEYLVEMEIIKEISIIISIWVAIYGIDSWRREYIGKRRMEIAEKLLALFYEAKDVISQIRSPFSFEGEGASRVRNEGETEEETQIYDQAYVAFERYEKHNELFNSIRSLRYQLMALHGHEAKKPFDELNGVVNEIFGASQQLSVSWRRQGRIPMDEAQRQQHLLTMRKSEAIFWEGMEEEDPINPRVTNIITADAILR